MGAERVVITFPGMEGVEVPLERLKQTAEDLAVRAKVADVAGEELRQFVERIESALEEKRKAAALVTEIYAEAKGRGFNVKGMRSIVALRRRKPDDVAEEQAVLDMYLGALGMG